MEYGTAPQETWLTRPDPSWWRHLCSGRCTLPTSCLNNLRKGCHPGPRATKVQKCKQEFQAHGQPAWPTHQAELSVRVHREELIEDPRGSIDPINLLPRCQNNSLAIICPDDKKFDPQNRETLSSNQNYTTYLRASCLSLRRRLYSSILVSFTFLALSWMKDKIATSYLIIN